MNDIVIASGMLLVLISGVVPNELDDFVSCIKPSLADLIMKALLVLLCAWGVQGSILPFLQTPKHDGVKRVCQLTSDNFTTVVTAADIAVVVVKDPLVTTKCICPTELETFSEVNCFDTFGYN
ncbi:uncharacterized protein TNCV_4795571 [Trichonephila clavipes]|nr:uncharacterized protein TNCV_4795571 [Trichonephila clavipes]